MSEPAHPVGAEASAIAATTQTEVEDEFRALGQSPSSPEAREEIARRVELRQRAEGVWKRQRQRMAPGTRPFEVAKRVIVGAYSDGFIHAGNLAYLALIALFPFFILTAAILTTLGDAADNEAAIRSVLATMPPSVAATIDAPLHEVLAARTGWLLWLGALVALWTVGSLIETVRDILRRAYGTTFSRGFLHYRLLSIAIIVGAVFLLLASFSAQVMVTALTEAITRLLPPEYRPTGTLLLTRAVTALGLFIAMFLLFVTLTPGKYRGRAFPKWPGALTTTLWWIAVTLALPPLLAGLLSYDATYGSLAGVMVTLFFFYLVGLGVVVGAELNAALVEPGARDGIGQADNRMAAASNERAPE